MSKKKKNSKRKAAKFPTQCKILTNIRIHEPLSFEQATHAKIIRSETIKLDSLVNPLGHQQIQIIIFCGLKYQHSH